jgi:hypothetical protein
MLVFSDTERYVNDSESYKNKHTLQQTVLRYKKYVVTDRSTTSTTTRKHPFHNGGVFIFIGKSPLFPALY